jgi:hypothetical protein
MSTLTHEVGENAPPVCLFTENPNRLVSLLDMLRFYAENFCRCSSLLGQIFVELRSGVQPVDTSWSVIGSALRDLEKYCSEMGLAITLAQIRRVNESVESGFGLSNPLYFGQQLIEIQTRMNDELAGRLIFSVLPNHAEYIEAFTVTEQPRQSDTRIELAWLPIFDSFPSVRYDSLEAFKCYAVGRNTACVFHLMRVLEIGLSSLAKHFGVSFQHANWERVINDIQKAIGEIDKAPNRPTNWRDDREFYSQCASHFRVIKDAWRNYTAHARGKYDADECSDILTGVRAFMQKLATRLRDEGV